MTGLVARTVVRMSLKRLATAKSSSHGVFKKRQLPFPSAVVMPGLDPGIQLIS